MTLLEIAKIVNGEKMNVKKQIRNFIYDNFLFADSNNGLQDDQSFMDTGIIDSTGILELITFVEETFEIQLEDEELIPENLDSLENLNRFIKKKKMAIGN